MVLTILGRRSDAENPAIKEGGYIIWELMATALNDMVMQVRIPKTSL